MTDNYDEEVTRRPNTMVSYDSLASNHPPAASIGQQIIQASLSPDANSVNSCQISSIPSTVDRALLSGSLRSPAATYTVSIEGSTTAPSLPALPTSPSTHLTTTAPVLPDNEPGGLVFSLRTSGGGQAQIHQKGGCSSFRSDQNSFDRDESSPRILIGGLVEHPQMGFRLYNGAAPNSGNKESVLGIPKAGTLLEDDILEVTIPVVRDVVHISTSGPCVPPH
ncbi:hypothetical protein PILCRDRAFT_827473 [Piloderma croceum F 1598]|uniref:Uncharacterized protein n=1 Tax=Piloderma croceum (strain F 1598) TaxID=765440 RepID=A0A0C3F5E3_PILCF|nr:hypothetical protein PILCRDRAFT_827473 [Piloderma croceum F 1598]